MDHLCQQSLLLGTFQGLFYLSSTEDGFCSELGHISSGMEACSGGVEATESELVRDYGLIPISASVLSLSVRQHHPENCFFNKTWLYGTADTGRV